MIPLAFTRGTWYVRPIDSAYEIVNSENNESFAIADEACDAALMSTAKEMLEALISIQEIITERLVEDDPVAKKVITETEINMIIDAINVPFGKIANEVPV